MVYKKRLDGREIDEMRPIKAEVGVIPNADGSALFAFGDTVAIAAVYGPKPFHPQHLQNPKRGIIRCNYNMLPFSVPERAKPGPTRRSREIGLIIENALSSVIDLSKFPGTVIDAEVIILQANASTRCAAINALAMALAHAGIVMKELISSVSIGKVDDKIVVDLTKEEEDWKEGEGCTDIPITITSRSFRISHLQLDGNLPIDKLEEVIKIAKKVCKKILEYQIRALKGEKIDEAKLKEKKK